MSDESMFLTGTHTGDGNGGSSNSGNNNNNDQNNNNLNVDYINADLEPYDLGDPFGGSTNLEESFTRNFLESTTANNAPTSNFSLDPLNFTNDFSPSLMGSYSVNNEDSNNAAVTIQQSSYQFGSANDHNEAGAGVPHAHHINTTVDMDRVGRGGAGVRDSPFDINQYQLNIPITGEEDFNQMDDKNSNGEEQDDAAQPKRSRATGEALQLLINEFSRNVNPNGAVRKQLADATGMSERSVRIWFQNRRAKAKKMEKLIKSDGSSSSRANSIEGYDSVGGGSTTASGGRRGSGTDKLSAVAGRHSLSTLQRLAKVPIMINENYCLVNCNSISIGTWQRIKSGYINSQTLKTLVNLSPKFLNSLMFTTDLLIILSKKNMEMNYFFSGFFQNNKILFRIFYPLEHILSCSLLNQRQAVGDSKEDVTTTQGSELRLTLSSPPKFAVFFLNNNNTERENSNQWSICDDFSEGQQVNNAYVGEGGSDTPHILAGGDYEALKFLNNFVLQYHQSQEAVSAAALIPHSGHTPHYHQQQQQQQQQHQHQQQHQQQAQQHYSQLQQQAQQQQSQQQHLQDTLDPTGGGILTGITPTMSANDIPSTNTNTNTNTSESTDLLNNEEFMDAANPEDFLVDTLDNNGDLMGQI